MHRTRCSRVATAENRVGGNLLDVARAHDVAQVGERPTYVAGDEAQELLGGSRKAANAQVRPDDDDHPARGGHDVLQVVVGDAELRHAGLELVVDGGKLLVRRLQLLFGGLELLVRRLQLLVRALKLLVGALQLLVGRLELFNRRLKVVLARHEVALELEDARILLALRPSLLMFPRLRNDALVEQDEQALSRARLRQGHDVDHTDRVELAPESGTAGEVVGSPSVSALCVALRRATSISGRASFKRLSVAAPGAGSRYEPVRPRNCTMSSRSSTMTPGGAYFSITLRSAICATLTMGRCSGRFGRVASSFSTARPPAAKSKTAVAWMFFFT